MTDPRLEAAAVALYARTRRGFGQPLTPAQRREVLVMWRTLTDESKFTWRAGAQAVIDALEAHDD